MVRGLLALLIFGATTTSQALPIGYGGRFVNSDGKPDTGFIDLEVRFFDQAAGGTQRGPTVDFNNVELIQGVFQITVDLGATDSDVVFGPATAAWIQIKDKTNNRILPRQQFLAVPYALKLPIDGTSLDFNNAGELKINAPLVPSKYLKSDGAGGVLWVDLATGTGDMNKADYDMTNQGDGKVDAAIIADTATLAATATDATQLNGQAASYYLNATNINAGTLADAYIPAAIARDSEIAAAARGAMSGTAPVTFNGGTGAIGICAATTGAAGSMSAADKTKLDGVEALADVTDATNVAAAGAVMDSDYTGNGFLARNGAVGAYAVVTNNSTDWNTAFTDRLKWDGGATGLNVTTAKTSLGYGSMADQNANAVAITGGTISGITMSFADDSISGDKIDSGVISNFESTGINDNAAATAVTIDGSGNVGIGTASPTLHLDSQRSGASDIVGSTAYGTGFWGKFVARSARGTAAVPTATQSGDALGTFGAAGYGTTGFASNSSGKMQVIAAENFTNAAQGSNLTLSTTPIGSSSALERVRIDPSGNVGIGTTSPSMKLEVVGGFQSRDVGAGGNPILIARAHPSIDAGELGTTSNHPQLFITNASEKMRISAAGNVGIGTTTPATELDVNGAVKIGPKVGSTCASAADGGKMRYDTATGKMQYCNGIALAWIDLNATPVTTAYDYGTTTGSPTNVTTGVKMAWGHVLAVGANTSVTITGLPFTSSTSYACMASENSNVHGYGAFSTDNAQVTAASTCVIFNRADAAVNVHWMAIGR